jgi:hypothetical protein
MTADDIPVAVRAQEATDTTGFMIVIDR